MCCAISVPNDRVSATCPHIFLRKFPIFRQCYSQIVAAFGLSSITKPSSGYGEQFLLYSISDVIYLTKFQNDFSTKSKKYFTKNIDSLTALQIAERCMYGPMTSNRLLATKIALSLTDSMNARLFTVEQIRQLQTLFTNIELFANYRSIIDRLTDTTFMYWHQSILSGYVRAVLNINRSLGTPTQRNSKEFRECACDFLQIYVSCCIIDTYFVFVDPVVAPLKTYPRSVGSYFFFKLVLCFEVDLL